MAENDEVDRKARWTSEERDETPLVPSSSSISLNEELISQFLQGAVALHVQGRSIIRDHSDQKRIKNMIKKAKKARKNGAKHDGS